MQFNVAKQPLIPAFLSLLLLTIIALTGATGGVVPTELYGGFSPDVLPIPLFGQWLTQMQGAHPTLARWIGGVLMLYTGASLGRLTLRYNLYGTGTCLAIPIYGLAMMGTMSSGNYLLAIVVSMLLMLTVKNLCMSYRNGFGFDRIFRSTLFFSLLIMIEPAALPLLVLYPIAARRFRRTIRELIVALGGLLIPFVTLCYLNWGLGGEFTAPLRIFMQELTAGTMGEAVLHSTLIERIFVGGLVLLNLTAYSLFRTNSYNVSIKARHILLFTSLLLLFCLLSALLPISAWVAIALLSVPTTLLVPVLFIRLHHSIAQLLYPLLIVAAIASLVLA